MSLIQPQDPSGACAVIVSVEEAKANSRVDFGDDDAVIQDCINAAISAAEAETARTVKCRERVAGFSDFSCTLRIPYGPVRSVSKLEYLKSGAWVELDAADYRFERLTGVLEPASSWPAVDRADTAVKVTYEAGFVEVPSDIKRAIILLTGHYYENREATVSGLSIAELPMAVEWLLGPYRDERYA